MFLPDYLYDNFESAQLNGKSLVSERFVVLDMPFEPGPKSVVPNLIFWGQFVIVCIIVFLYFRSRQKPYRTLHVLYVIAGLLSIALLLLWFATDHTTTADNLNLLWANPICVLLLFFSREGRLRKVLEMVYLAVLFVVLVAWNKLGQEFHPLVLPLVLSLFVTLGAVVLMKPSRK